MGIRKTNYEKQFPELKEKDLDEKYALITHAMQLGTEKYIEILNRNGIEVHREPRGNDSKFTFVDLFAGIGGFRLAMQSVGGECVFSSEWDEAAKETYFDNYKEVPFGDITKPEVKALIPDYFDVLCAGFPCQPFSNAGLRKGIEDTRGTLFYHIAEILQKHRPKAVLLENVRGLISNDEGRTIRTILKTITHMGYRCNIPQEIIENGSKSKLKDECSKMVLNARDYGVPQNRARIFIVLWRDDLEIDEFVYPKPDSKKTRLGDILESEVPEKYTISDNLWAWHQKRKAKHEKRGNGFGYGLFDSDSEYANTILKRYYKDGSEILIAQEGKNPRKLTPREAANLQGFPKNFRLPSSDIQAYQQFGNSVAVPVVKKIAEQIVIQILN